MTLLDILAKKAQETLNGVGNFVNQNVIHPIQQDIQGWATKNPQQAQQVTQAPQNIAKSFSDIVNSLRQQPIAPTLPFKTPTVGQAVDFVKPPVLNLVDTFASPFRDIAGQVKVNSDPKLKAQLDAYLKAPPTPQEITNKKAEIEMTKNDPIKPIGATKDLSQEDIIKRTQDFYAKNKIGETPAQSESAQKGAELGMSFTAPAMGTNYMSDAAPFVAPVVKQGVQATKDLFGVGKTAEAVIPKVVTKAGDVKAGIVEPIVSTGKKTADLFTKTTNSVAQDLKNTGKAIQATVDAVENTTKPAKGLFKQTVNAVIGNKEIQGARGVLKTDSPAGKLAVDIATQAENKWAELAGNANAKLRAAFNGLSDKELGGLHDVITGKAKAISEAQQIAADTWKSIADEIHQIGTSTGHKIGKVENYFPQFSVDKAGRATIDGTTVDKGGSFTFANFRPRYGVLTDYIKNPDVLFSYIDGAYKTIVDSAYLGSKAKNLYSLAYKSANPGQATKIVENILGEGDKGGLGSAIANKITNLQRTKLGITSPFTNLTQQISVMGRTDIPTAIKTYAKIIQNPQQAILNAIRAHEIDPALGKKALDYLGSNADKSIGSRWLGLIKFGLSEKMNRIVSVNAGMEYATKLISQAQKGSGAAVRELERLGIKDFVKATEQDIINAGRKVSLETQFSTRNGQLPTGWDTAGGRVLTQFKSFSYKQTGFLKGEAGRIWTEAKHGNMKPLVTALSVYSTAPALMGEIVNDVRSFATNKKRTDKNLGERYIQDVISGSSLGLLDNAGALMGQYGAAGIAGALGGPMVSDLVNLGVNASKAVAGKPATLERQALRAIPGVGPLLSNTLVANDYIETYLGKNSGRPSKVFDNTGILQKAQDFLGGSSNQSNGDSIVWQNASGIKTTVDLTPSTATGIGKYGAESDKAAKAVKIWGAPTDQVSDTEKIAAYKKLGYTADQVRYAFKADFTVDEKSSYMIDQNLPHDKLISSIVTGRVESIKGDLFASNGVIDNLVDAGLVSKAEAKYLKSIKVSKDGKLATSSLKGTGGLTAAQRKAKITSLNSLFKKRSDGATPKAIKIPTVKTPTLSLKAKKGTTQKSKNVWFQAY